MGKVKETRVWKLINRKRNGAGRSTVAARCLIFVLSIEFSLLFLLFNLYYVACNLHK
uniref:Uncharacterized protein n=1 Tax=Nelumbo nucifera TaxID=4432 RepID=A0A822ZGF0_NELNU|nr:TPA_asm: hypothetical protein HUJ06_002442 [Nelumbo nucifera]